jgi:hypothetical protein
MDDEMRQCVVWGLQQRQAGLFTSVATMSGRQHAYILWIEDSKGGEIQVILPFDEQPPICSADALLFRSSIFAL